MTLLTRRVHLPPTLAGDMQTGNALANLAIARGSVLDDAISVVYTKQLEDLDSALVERVCVQLANAPRREYETALPSVGTIRELALTLARQDAEREAVAKLLPLPVTSDDDDPRTRYFCPDCRDESSGWREMFCTGASAGKDLDRRPVDFRTAIYYCGRKFQHSPHAYVEKCACADTNPVIADRRHWQARHTSEPRA